jgi:Yip1 domain
MRTPKAARAREWREWTSASIISKRVGVQSILTMTPEQLPELEPQPKGMSEASRLTGVFFEPSKAFADIAERPNFWVPLILSIISAVTYITLFSQHVGWERMIRHQTELSSRAATLTPEQRETQIQMGAKFAPVFGYVGVTVGIPIVLAIWAAVLLGIVKGIMSAPVRFKQVFAILCYAGLPGVIFTILAIAVMFMKSPDDFNMQNPLVFNPGAFLDQASTSKFVYSVASSLDLFRIWTMVLIGFGLKAAGGKQLSMGGAMAAVFVPWLVWTLCAGALAGVFS